MSGDVIQFPEDRKRQQEQIYFYRRAGENFNAIAEKLQISVDEAIKGYRHYMVNMARSQNVNDKEETILLELDRLDQLQIPFYVAGTEGEKEGAEIYLKIASHRAKLLKLDQPTQQELNGRGQVIVVTGSKEDFERALVEGRMKQVAGRVGDDDDDKEGS